MSAKFWEVSGPFDQVRCLNKLTGEPRGKSGAVCEFHKNPELGLVEVLCYSEQLSYLTRVHPRSSNPSFHNFSLNRDIVVIPVKCEFSLGVSKNYDSEFIGKIL